MHKKEVEDRKQEMESQEESRPSCFGDLERVCPRDEDGIMQPQAGCLPCASLKACLQEGLRREGMLPKPEWGTPAVSRVSSFLRRWSKQKLAQGSHSQEEGGDSRRS